MSLRWLVLACLVAACTPAPSAPEAPARPTRWATPAVPPTRVVSTPPSHESRASLDVVDTLAGAYRAGAAGEAAFRGVVGQLRERGAAAVEGLGDIEGFIVEGATMAAFQTKALTYFFDAASGRIAFAEAEVDLHATAPVLPAPYFLTALGELYDPVAQTDVEVPGNTFAVHPDGHRLYVTPGGCTVEEWSLDTKAVTRRLATPPHDGCATLGFPLGEVTTDGRHLISPWGRWELATGRVIPSPFIDASVVLVAVSPGARYIARIIPNAHAKGLTDANLVQVHDVATGTTTTASPAVGTQSNSASLSFHAHPLRICVSNYSHEVFLVPSLQPLAPEALAPGPIGSCELASPPPAADHPALRRRLASQVCALGGLLVPREHCEGAGDYN